MAEFEAAIGQTLKNEGSEFFHNQKTGEVVRYGVTLRTYRELVDEHATEDTIRSLTEAQAVDFYRRFFWKPLSLDAFASQKLAAKLFDLAVNMGTGTAVRLLQRACNALGVPLEEDGRVGRATISAANRLDETVLYAELLKFADERYRKVATMPNNAGFLPGWLNRLYNS